jgi:hypothetical protein
MFEIYSLTDDGFEQSLGYYDTEDDAYDALEFWCQCRPNAYVDIREVN